MAFEWFKGMFSGGSSSPQAGTMDPEAGVQISEYSGLGRSEGRNEGSGEGFSNWGSMSKQQYGDLGRAFQQQQVGSANAQGGLNAGFDNNWLAEQEHAGSAEGQHL